MTTRRAFLTAAGIAPFAAVRHPQRRAQLEQGARPMVDYTDLTNPPQWAPLVAVNPFYAQWAPPVPTRPALVWTINGAVTGAAGAPDTMPYTGLYGQGPGLVIASIDASKVGTVVPTFLQQILDEAPLNQCSAYVFRPWRPYYLQPGKAILIGLAPGAGSTVLQTSPGPLLEYTQPQQ